MTRVLLVENEATLADVLVRALTRAGYATTTAPTAAGALALAEHTSFDIALLDAALPDADGHDVCVALRRRNRMPIVMFAETRADADFDAWHDGADDYVVKPVRGEDAIVRIRSVLHRFRSSPNQAEILRTGPFQVDTIAHRAQREGRELKLTPKELELLARLMRDAGRVVTRMDLIEDVWDRRWPSSTRTLDVHIGWLRRKLGDTSADPRFIHTVRGIGFRLSSHEELARARAA